MKVVNLTIRNFMAVGEVESLPLNDKGLILIQGENLDDTSQTSNGAGKSSIADALCWAFYGETARKESGDAIVNRTAKKGTEVVVTLLDDAGDTYRVSRYRKHKTYKNMLRVELAAGESWNDLTKGTDKLTQELVNKVLGCTHEVFTSSIYAGQEAMPDLPGMTDKNLKVLVEEAAGIDQLQKAHDIARQKLTACKVEVTDLTTQINTLLNAKETFKANVEAAETERDGWETRRAAGVAALEARIAASNADFDATLGGRIESKIQDLKSQADAVRSKIAQVDVERVRERELATLADDASRQASQAEIQLAYATDAAKKLKHDLEHCEDKVGSACGSCGHVIEATDLSASKEAIKQAAREQIEKAKRLKTELESKRQAHSDAVAALSDYRSSMTDISAQAVALSELEDKTNKLRGAHKSWEARAQELNDLSDKLAAGKAQANPHDDAIERAKKQVEAAEHKLTSISDLRDEAQARMAVAEEAVRVFGPAGVRAHILDNVTPYLNLRTSHYLSTLTDGNVTAVWSTISTTAKGELREKFAIDVSSATGGESFKSLSGGEKRKVRLATAMALQDLVASRATKPIKLFMADEIDAALDAAGLERLMTILEEKSHDKGTVLVITHTDLRDWIRNSITITKKGGQSTLEAACLS